MAAMARYLLRTERAFGLPFHVCCNDDSPGTAIAGGARRILSLRSRTTAAGPLASTAQR